MQKRRRFKQQLTLTERLDEEATRLRAQADKMAHGPERENCIRKARQAETAVHVVAEWFSPPGLGPRSEP